MATVMQNIHINTRVSNGQTSDASMGLVKLSLTKLFWIGGMIVISIVGGIITFRVDSLLLFCLFTAFTLCFGHSLGMHRRLIHQSYQCPKWLEYFFVHLGVLVGLAGPFGMIKTHDLRDWAQRQKSCHSFLGHQQAFSRDAYWQLFCDLELSYPPTIEIEQIVKNDKVYQWMEKYWMWQQLPWALLFFAIGGISWVVWGICMRVSVSVIGHWLIGFFAHNHGDMEWEVESASIQGHNIPFISLLTMGESWHNNHHAFPNSAKLGLTKGQWDPGWWMLSILQKLGLAWDFVVPKESGLKLSIAPSPVNRTI